MERPVLAGDDVIDAAVLGELDGVDVVHHLERAALGGVSLQVLSQQAGVEMVGVGELHLVIRETVLLFEVRVGEALLDLVVEDPAVVEARGPLGIAELGDREAGVVEGLVVALELQPPLSHVEAVDDVVALEGVIEVAAILPPVLEFDCKLVGGVAVGHPIFFVEPEEVEEELDGAEGRLADADRLDVGGLDQRDFNSGNGFLEVGRGHPASGTTTNDHDTLGHEFTPLKDNYNL
jgi:hypothetical protein